MKRHYLTAASIAMLLTGCYQGGIEQEEMTDGRETGMEVAVRCVELEPLTRATIADMETLAYVLMDDEGVVESGVRKTGLSALSLDADPGEYTLLLMSNRLGTEPEIDEEGIIGYERPGDAFAWRGTVTVTNGARTSAQAELTRRVAQMRWTSTDAVPSGVTKVRFTLTGVCLAYDANEGTGVDETSYSGTANVTAGQTWSTYTTVFIEGEAIADATLTFEALKADGTVLSSKTFADLPLKVNHKTRLTAGLFTTYGGDAVISVNDTWGEDINVTRGER